MIPEFALAIKHRVESEILPMVESLNAFVGTLPLHPSQKHQIMHMVITDMERIQQLCWEGAAEIAEEQQADIIRSLRRFNKL